MNIEDIKVGTTYHDPHTGNILLGIGVRKLFTENEFTEKHLVVIEAENPNHIGMMIQEGENCEDGYWDSIEEYDSNTVSRILYF